jgi:hypothetical protein
VTNIALDPKIKQENNVGFSRIWPHFQLITMKRYFNINKCYFNLKIYNTPLKAPRNALDEVILSKAIRFSMKYKMKTP